jgi:hypothetical protein
VTQQGRSSSVTPVRGGTTDLGAIRLALVRAVGYYDTSFDSGNGAQAGAIVQLGLQAVNIGSLATARLDDIQVLLVQNPDNGGYGFGYTSNLAKVAEFVSAGGVLVFHDRHVASAQNVLPGAAGDIRRDLSDDRNINVIDDSTSLTHGPGGVITNSTLDNGNSSSHGFTVAASIPAGSHAILSRGNPAELVTFAYPFGSGWVVYSTIPLDFYLGGGTAFGTIYAPNVLAFAKDLREGRVH